MGLLDSVLGNPQIADAARRLLNPEDTSVGGSAGLTQILGALQSSGLGDAVASWLSSGPNQSVAPAKLESALGSDLLSSFASKAGIDASEAGAVLAGVLPSLVDKLSPQGQVPDTGSLEQMLGGVLGSLSQRA